MSKGFYFKLAASNIKKNARNYVPFMITSVITAAMFYIICSLAGNENLKNLPYGAASATSTLNLGRYVTGIFAFIFLFYTNSFLMKRRKKELGLFNILGMEKKHIAKVIAIETVYVLLITLALGFTFGILLDKIMFLIIIKILDADIVLGFYVSLNGIRDTIILFGATFFLMFLNSLRQITFSKPIELLKGGNAGEKEPKARWLLAILGTICLGSGYYLAVTIKNPMKALTVFFVAVILVIIGTYLIFTAGSIALLKILRKNKRYYYKTKHFISVSGMMYRMKQNAVGLGNICILATMVLVTISSTASMMIGMDDLIKNNYPYDFQICSFNNETGNDNSDDNIDLIYNVLEENNVKVTKEIHYRYISTTVMFNDDGLDFQNADSVLDSVDLDDIFSLVVIPLEDYNTVFYTDLTLNKNEIYIQTADSEYEKSDLRISDKTYKVKGNLDSFGQNSETTSNIVNPIYVVVNDYPEVECLFEAQKAIYKEHYSLLSTYMGFSVKGDDEYKIDLKESIDRAIESADNFSGYCVGSVGAIDEYMSIFGSLFFIGIFLSVLFTMAAVLIIYYKQISEGYDDKERFEIMQKVGMSQSEVKGSIRSQILTVFFLPLVTAGIHVAFAFPMINKILELMEMNNKKLFAICTLGSFLVFAIIYGIVYMLTAKIYYKIVKR